MRRVGPAIAIAFAIACAGTRAPEVDRAYQAGLAPVERIDVQVFSERPVSVHVRVYGQLPDTCTALDRSRQERLGSGIDVTLTTRRESGPSLRRRAAAVPATDPARRGRLAAGPLLRQRERRTGKLPDLRGSRRAQPHGSLSNLVAAGGRSSLKPEGRRSPPPDGRCIPRPRHGRAARSRSARAPCWARADRPARRRGARGGAGRTSNRRARASPRRDFRGSPPPWLAPAPRPRRHAGGIPPSVHRRAGAKSGAKRSTPSSA